MVKFKDFSRPLSVFQVLFKTNLIFQGLFKTVLYFKVLFKPVRTLATPNMLTSLHHNYLLSEKSNYYMLHPKILIFLLVSKGVDRTLKKSHTSKGGY